MCNLIVKRDCFLFDNECLNSFTILKEQLVIASLITTSNWDFPFELMCDTSDYTVGMVFGQLHVKLFYSIYYASNVLNEKKNYYTIEKEFLALIFALEKFGLI